MISIIIRISLRYVAAFLMARGLLSPEIGATLADDTDIIQMTEFALGALTGLAAEAWLYADRKFGSEK